MLHANSLIKHRSGSHADPGSNSCTVSAGSSKAAITVQKYGKENSEAELFEETGCELRLACDCMMLLQLRMLCFEEFWAV